jgi:maleate isomerase
MPVFGWRKRIGYITPTVMEIVPYEFYRFAPDGIGLVGVTCNIEDWRPEQYENGLSAVRAQATYLASRHVDFIIHGGAPLIINRGPGYDRVLIDELHALTGLPVTTGVRAAMDALEHMNVNKVALVTPYPEKSNVATAAFLESNGFNVVFAAQMDVGFKELQEVQPEQIYRLVMDVAARVPEAEGFYVPCPQWSIYEVLPAIERDTGKPVISSTPANMFAAFKELRVHDEIRGHGLLLESLAKLH